MASSDIPPQPDRFDFPDSPSSTPDGSFLSNFKTNAFASFTTLSAKDWIRLVIIIGGYMLLRKFIVQYARYRQKADLEKNDKEGKEEARKWTVGEFRRMNQTYLDQLDDDPATVAAGAGKSTGLDDGEDKENKQFAWGDGARLKQRKALEEKMREMEEKYADRDSDAEIEEFLIDD